MRRLAELCRALLDERYGAQVPPRIAGGRGAAGGGAADHRRARARRLLPAAPRAAGAGREVAAEVRGSRLARALLRAGPRAGLLGVLDRLLPDRPLAHRPDRQPPVTRALPAHRPRVAARHRPRLPARHPRGADPPRARALRQRARRAGRRLPDLPRARRDPRARQGAGPAPGGDRARGPRGGQPRAAEHDIAAAGRARSGSSAGRRACRRALAPLGVAGAPGRRGVRAAPPPLPAPRRDGDLHAAVDRLLPRGARGDGGPPDGAVGQGLLRGRRLLEDRPARAGDALRGGSGASS